MRIDFHTHSTASDGQYTPSQLVEMAKEKELEKFAITDHDTVEGIKEAREKALELGVDFVAGIEISTHKGEEIHIVGLGIDENNPRLVEECSRYMEERVSRGQRICDFLTEKGIPVTLAEAEKVAGDGSLGRPHFARILQEKGVVKTRQEAFDRYLNTAEFHQKTDRLKPSPSEAIELIHEAGGKAVLAHPGLLKMGKRWQESLIHELTEAGLDGIEVFYNKHTFVQTKFYKKLALDGGLEFSCGSDYHGEKVKPNVMFGMEIDDAYRANLISVGKTPTSISGE